MGEHVPRARAACVLFPGLEHGTVAILNSVKAVLGKLAPQRNDHVVEDNAA